MFLSRAHAVALSRETRMIDPQQLDGCDAAGTPKAAPSSFNDHNCAVAAEAEVQLDTGPELPGHGQPSQRGHDERGWRLRAQFETV